MRLLGFCSLMIVSLIGCGAKAEPRRVELQGSVIVGEKLVPEAMIRFLPEKGNSGPVVVTPVAGGLYKFSKLDGPYPGMYKVVVNLELSDLSKTLGDDPNATPQTVWETIVTVPDKEAAIQHLIWKSAAEEKAEAKKEKAETSQTTN